ncbi:Phosphatidylinositol-3-phosphate phosphatase [Aphelenchoides besseyi]|nr:Phosphatidylinositol-3-phosphate phosphatase [Aphelenchoides besseyi]
MPCKGDECCNTESERRDYESPTKETINFAMADNIRSPANLSSSASSSEQPVNISRSLVNGHANGDLNRGIVNDRKHHTSGISFEAVSPLIGEELKQDGVVDLANCRSFLSNYRIVVVTHNRQGACSIPIVGVDNVEAVDEMLKISCKDGRVFSISAETQETAMNWFKMITPLVCGARGLQDLFAYRFATSCAKQRQSYLRKVFTEFDSLSLLQREFNNCEFKDDEWQITKVNEDFKICASYPKYLIVPKATSDQELAELKRGRFFDRFPTAVWRSKTTGAVLMRSSQPEVSFFGTPQEGDIKLFDAIRNVTVVDKKRKLMIIDARSYTAAWANRAKGGGFESGEAYNGTEILFMGLPNIHSLRYSFHQLRQLLHSAVNVDNYFQALNASQWFHYLFNLIISSQRCVESLCTDGNSVLVHCSDGWDRTAQIVSLAKIICDRYYRTFEGFEHLIQREWIEFGHKFNDRNGMTCTDTNERSPVFMQFLDAVHQLWLRNPDMFEFNQRYLMKLAQHQYSGMFGTFLFNNYREFLSSGEFVVDSSNTPVFDNKNETNTRIELISVFDYLGKHNTTFVNPVFDSRKTHRLICPKAMWELQVWREVFCCSDLEGVVNNPDTAYHPFAGESPSHNDCTVSDKMSTMSRSQSAASLNSLEQSTNGIHWFVFGNGALNHSSQNTTGTTFAVGSSYSTISYISRREYYLPPGKTYVDVDGLSRVPIEYEDRILELQRQAVNLNNSARSASDSESSISRESKRETDNHPAVRRCRVESSDSTLFTFDVLEELDKGRCKRDSTCSSNIILELHPPRTTSDIPALNEEEFCTCEKCHKVTDENSEPLSRKKNEHLHCECCSNHVLPGRSNGVVVS